VLATQNMKIDIAETINEKDKEFISESLFQYNCRKSGINDFSEITIYLRNEADEIIGGIIGWSRWGWSHIENLWIDELNRNKGYGGQLLSEFEEISLQRGCSFIDLDTFNFQAPSFYVKYGYKEMFVMDGIKHGITKHYLKKELL
jgi:ribosomal protein S18 acetylase RimI-like enzyme